MAAVRSVQTHCRAVRRKRDSSNWLLRHGHPCTLSFALLPAPQVEWKSLPHEKLSKTTFAGHLYPCTNQKVLHYCWKQKSWKTIQNYSAQCPESGGLYFSENQDADRTGEEQTILLGRSNFSSTLRPNMPKNSPATFFELKTLRIFARGIFRHIRKTGFLYRYRWLLLSSV
jgi:hypothetical protein